MDLKCNQPDSPTRTTPTTAPQTEPLRRMRPGELCPAQRSRVGETIRRTLRP